MKQAYKTLTVDVEDGIARVTFRRDKDTNAFCRDMTLDLMDVCRTVAEDELSPEPRFTALVLTGGMGRSFSVGGDFNDVSVLEHEHEVRPWLGEIIDLYIAILSVNIPVVAAMDRFAIGQGLQVALMADWRIGTTRVPALDARAQERRRVSARLGDPRGSAGASQDARTPARLRIHRRRRGPGAVPPQRDHTARASSKRPHFGSRRDLRLYPRTPYVTTKRIHNGRFIAALEEVREPSSQAHVASFEQHTGKSHFDRILKRA